MSPDGAQTCIFRVRGGIIGWVQVENVLTLNYFAPAGGLWWKSIVFSRHLKRANFDFCEFRFKTMLFSNFESEIIDFTCVATSSSSGPCSIDVLHPREWRIAIPASSMWVDKTYSVTCLCMKSPGNRDLTEFQKTMAESQSSFRSRQLSQAAWIL